MGNWEVIVHHSSKFASVLLAVPGVPSVRILLRDPLIPEAQSLLLQVLQSLSQVLGWASCLQSGLEGNQEEKVVPGGKGKLPPAQ